MKALVISGRSDFHAEVVSCALESRGHQVYRLASDDFACVDSVNIDMSSGRMDGAVDLAGEVVALRTIDVVWNRRPYESIVPGSAVADDRPFARNQIRAALWGIYYLLDRAYWLNPFDSVARAENKIHQLRCAVEVGLPIPTTLVSSSAKQIREFIRKESDCIFKPLSGYVWEKRGKRQATYTASVDQGDLPSDGLLRAAPGIYQRRVVRDYEVRAQFFGQSCAAIRIDVNDDACIDWRMAQAGISRCDPVEVPRQVQERCLALMGRLGIVCGAFDFLVQSSGEWIFLEVNQAGQFLFLENWCPQLPVLDMFCEMMERPSPQFKYSSPSEPVRFEETVRSCMPSKTSADVGGGLRSSNDCAGSKAQDGSNSAVTVN